MRSSWILMRAQMTLETFRMILDVAALLTCSHRAQALCCGAEEGCPAGAGGARRRLQ